MRKTINTNGEVIMVREESDDIIATLEQENRQLHARNQRLEKEMEDLQGSAVETLRAKLHMEDDDVKFKAFQVASKLVARCFDEGKGRGVLVVETENKLSIMGLNADVDDVIDLANELYEKLEAVMEHNGDEKRTLN